MPRNGKRPLAKRCENRQQTAPLIGQRIDAQAFVVVDNAAADKLRQPPGQNACGDAGHTGPDHLKPFRGKHQLTHHKQGPAIPDQVQRMRGKTAFFISDVPGFCRFSH